MSTNTVVFETIRPWLDERGFTPDRIKALDTALARMRGEIVVEGKPDRRRINAAGLKLIKEFEGLRTSAYLCPAGIPTIGYGSTGPHVRMGMTITEARAEELLREDLERFERAVEKEAPNATDNQFSALVSFSFNVGEAALRKSTVMARHKAGDHENAAKAFALWNKGGGRVLPGLVRRRAAEAALYRKADA